MIKVFLVFSFGLIFTLLGCSSSLPPVFSSLEPKGMDPGVEERGKYFYQGLAYTDRGEWDNAVFAFQRALENDPELAGAHNNLGILFKQKDQGEQALNHYRKAVELVPASAEIYYNLGILLREMGRFQEAEKSYLDALRIKEDFAPAYFNLGILYDLYLNRPEAAIRQYVFLGRIQGKTPQLENWILNLEERMQIQRKENDK